MSEKPFQWLDGGTGRRSKVYLHEALERVTVAEEAAGGEDPIDWTALDPEDAREALPSLRAGLEARAKFVTMVEAIAEGNDPVICPACGSRFYPSRSDARFCGSTCRMRAHREARR